MTTTSFDPQLIRRYDRNGPRYTSYPTADRFTPGDWTETYERELSNADTRSLSLYLHVPFCSTICFYCACNKINTANIRHADDYVRRLVREMELHAKHMQGQHAVEQLHFGGGTPTFLSDDQFTILFDALRRTFQLYDGDDRDFSIEVDPRNVPAARIEHLASLGINRLSVGVQDFDRQVQRAVNRLQTLDETKAVIDAARANGIRSINIDLINGLPKQTASGFTQTLEQVIALQPDRLSLYSYAHLPKRFKTQRQINCADLPNADDKLNLLQTAISILGDAGYEYVGMDHFAKPEDPLIRARNDGTLHRSFQGYTTHGHCQQIGLGVSSIGKVGRLYIQNVKNLRDYYAAIDAGRLALERGIEVGERDAIVASVIQDLMCRSSVSYESFFAMTGCRFVDMFADRMAELARLERDGLVDIRDTELAVTDRGRFLVRNICMVFDDWIGADTEKFSRAI